MDPGVSTVTSVILVVVVAASISTVVTYVLLVRRLIVIHDLVNSNLTRVQADLTMAQSRIETLEKHLVEMGRMELPPTSTS